MMSHEIDNQVKVNARVLIKDRKTGKTKLITMTNVMGIIQKIDNANGVKHYYVKTKHGMHYLHESKVSDIS